MAILNANTTVSAARTIEEIQELLRKRKAQSMTILWDETGAPSALKFIYQDEEFTLPCRAALIQDKLKKTPGLKSAQRTLDHAHRVGWRVIKSWLLAQFAIIDTGMVDMGEVMLPYMTVRPGKTTWDVYREQRADRTLEDKK